MTLLEERVDLDVDRRARWRPSEEQIEGADRLLAVGAGAVFTAHLLIGKERGWWTEEVVVWYVPGFFQMRDDCRYATELAARQAAAETGEPLIGGFAWHHGQPGTWAVWEDPAVEYVGVREMPDRPDDEPWPEHLVEATELCTPREAVGAVRRLRELGEQGVTVTWPYSG